MSDNWNPGFPVHIYHENMELPKEGTYFVVAGNGIWMHKHTGICRCFVPVKNISCLDDLKAEAELQVELPRLPAQFVWQIKEFFRQVVDKYHAESGISLFYSKVDDKFQIDVPEQKVSHGGVKYIRSAMTHLEGSENYLRVGTIHSHCDFGAFHSGTDVGDEKDFDGLHVTFGHNDRDDFTISASFVVNASRVTVDPLTVLDGVSLSDQQSGKDSYYKCFDITEEQKAEWSEPISGWMEKVSPAYTFTHSYGLRFWERFAESQFKKEDQIVWAKDESPLKDSLGEGPFKVVECELEKDDFYVTIETRSGKAKLPEFMFKKV